MASLLDLAEARLRGLLDVQRQPRPSMVGLLGGKEPQGTLASTISGYTPPQMQAMSNQQVMDYARNVASSARQNLQNQMSDLDKALVMDQGGINVGDRQALARLMEQIPGLMGAVAYHGTPHTIRGKFDISKVGTGEGAQSYGHGMYFAENPDVAKQYQKDLSNFYEPYVQYGKEKIAGQGLSDVDLNVYKYLEIGKKQAGEFPHNTQYYAKKIAEKANDLEALKKLQENSDIKFGEQFNRGNLYKVDIPDEYIPNMLDWDKPLSQQPKSVQNALAKFDPDTYSPKGMDYEPTELGQGIYMRIANSPQAKNFPEASALLDSLGIKGIRYLDEGSRSAGKGSSNFVVFDPTEVKILEKNKKKIEGLLD